MKKALFLILIFTCSIYSQINSSEIAGAYQWCPFPCETYKINTDFTFDYLLDGDLFNNERAKGTWQLIGENKIHLKTPERKIVHKVTEESGEKTDSIVIQVKDTAGALFPGITIKTTNKGKEYQLITDETGLVDIPKSNKFEIGYFRFSEVYEIKDSKTTRLSIEINPFIEPFVDDVFLLKKDALCKIFENGEISENCYQKLNKKTAKKLFPVK